MRQVLIMLENSSSHNMKRIMSLTYPKLITLTEFFLDNDIIVDLFHNENDTKK